MQVLKMLNLVVASGQC